MDETQRINDGAGAGGSVPEPLRPEPVPPPGPETTASGTGGSTSGEPVQQAQDQMADKFQEVVDRLKPVAVAAEDAATTAVDMTAKGLSKLASYLDKRRQDRQSREHVEGPPDQQV